MILLHDEQGSPEWKQSRAGVITASRFSDARGRLTRATKTGGIGDPTADAVKYACQVAIERIAGQPIDNTFATWQMRRGTELEPEARERYEALTGHIVEQAGLALTDDRVFGYSTDGLVDVLTDDGANVSPDGLVEIKCPAAPEKIVGAWRDPAAAADEYIDQIHGGLWITGRKWCDLVVYCPWLRSVGKDILIHRIWRDDDAIDALADDLLAFARVVDRHESMLRGLLPAPTTKPHQATPPHTPSAMVPEPAF